MGWVRVHNRSRGVALAERARHATGLWERLVGLLGTDELGSDLGLVLEPCNSVHMFGMRYPIDVLFLDAAGRVLHIAEGLRPWRMTKVVRGARVAIELPVETVMSSGTTVGDEMYLEAIGE